MKDLYLALWGKELPIVQDFRIQVPQADNGIRPGYKITMRPSASGKTFAPPQFMSKAKEEVFKIIEVGAMLPCGVQKLLVRPEYEKTRQRLIRAEQAKWVGASNNSEDPRICARLDYEVSGQPGIGIKLFAF